MRKIGGWDDTGSRRSQPDAHAPAAATTKTTTSTRPALRMVAAVRLSAATRCRASHSGGGAGGYFLGATDESSRIQGHAARMLVTLSLLFLMIVIFMFVSAL